MAVLTEKQIKYGFDYYHKDEKQQIGRAHV